MFHYVSVSWISVTHRFISVSYWPGKCNFQFCPSINFSAVLYEATEQVGRVVSKSSPKLRLCCFCETFLDEYVEMAPRSFYV